MTLIYVALLKEKSIKSPFFYLRSNLVVFYWFVCVPEDNLGPRSVFFRFLFVNPWINLSSLRFVMTLEERMGTNTQLQ